jgi:predicted phosphodiesterase
MRYAILSDIHSNLDALEAVMTDIGAQNINQILCAGDIVGYGAAPEQCLDVIRTLKITTVAGNHDQAVSGALDPMYFREEGKKAIVWTQVQISKDNLQFLKQLDLSYKNDDLILVHGSLEEPDRFFYLFDITNAMATFEMMDRKVCFVGHTHIPQIFVKQDHRAYLAEKLDIPVEKGCKYIVNVGSVGQPRDQLPLASYCIYDKDEKTVQIRRVPYDINAAQMKILEANLPEMLARRLAIGQ